ncbi:MAG: YtxH domain-containing protein [Chloroflexi bacterium]|nr:YtxH domain-containing protein [Chloroflexota bacterium]
MSIRFLLGFLIGAALGASVALAVAPQPGAAVRQRLWDQVAKRTRRAEQTDS